MPPLEVDQAVDPDRPADRDVEGLGQRLGQGRQQKPLVLPGRGDARSRLRAVQALGPFCKPRVCPCLERLEALEHLAVGIERPALIADAALDLSLRLRLAGLAGVHMEAKLAREAPVRRVHRAPAPGPLRDRRLDVVDAQHRRHSAQPPEAAQMTGLPRQHVLRAGPNHHTLAAPGQHHDKRDEILGRAAQNDPGIFRPVDLRLRPSRRLDPATRPDRRRRIRPAPIALNRLQAPCVAVLALEPLVQGRQIDRTAALLVTPMIDRRRIVKRQPELPPFRHEDLTPSLVDVVL
nr:hypothetical protein [Salinarimonas rosea]